MPFLNFTELAAPNSVLTNVSYTIANQPPQMTTLVPWLIFALAGITLLLLSRLVPEPTFKDLSGAMAIPLLLISAIQSFAVDTITGTVFTTGTASPVLGVAMEVHTVYHYDLIGVVLGIFFVLSLLNAYLLWLDSKRILKQEQPDVDRTSPTSRNRMPERKGRGDNDDDEM